MSLNFSDFFKKLAAMFRSLGIVTPILREFQEIFSESSELRESLLEFHAIVVEFCTEALRFLKKRCRYPFAVLTFPAINFFSKAIQQFSELLWRNPFDFQQFETQLLEQKQTIILRQTLASEKAAYKARLQISLYQQRGEQHRSEEVSRWMGNEERQIQKSVDQRSKLHDYLSDLNEEALTGIISR